MFRKDARYVANVVNLTAGFSARVVAEEGGAGLDDDFYFVEVTRECDGERFVVYGLSEFQRRFL